MNASSALQLAAARIQRPHGSASVDVAKSMERLATGKRINRAADDPAGLVVVDPLKSRASEISGMLRSIDRSDAYLGAREGGLSVLSDSLVELKQLAVTAANRDALSQDERDALQIQASEILKGIDFLANTSSFQNQQILTGFNTQMLGLSGLLDAANLATGDSESADNAISSAINTIASSRATIGNAARDNDSQRRSLLSEQESLAGVVSSIQDTDYAKETAALVRARLMQDVAAFLQKDTLMSESETVLSLLKGVSKAK